MIFMFSFSATSPWAAEASGRHLTSSNLDKPTSGKYSSNFELHPNSNHACEAWS